jgi:hypothetical protein
MDEQGCDELSEREVNLKAEIETWSCMRSWTGSVSGSSKNC